MTHTYSLLSDDSFLSLSLSTDSDSDTVEVKKMNRTLTAKVKYLVFLDDCDFPLLCRHRR